MVRKQTHDHGHGHGHGGQRTFLSAAGHDALLPFYDLMARLGGAGRLYDAVVDAVADAVAEVVDVAAGEPPRVLDVGCGTGTVLARLAGRLPGAQLTGADPDERVLRRARRKVARAGGQARWAEAFAQELPFPDGAFDVVVSSMMLHHLVGEAKAEMLAEVRRVLAAGGTFVLADVAGPMRGHRLARHRHGPAPEFTDDLAAPVRAAGLVDVVEVARPTIRFGDVRVLRARRAG